jgi:hypothetical protein
MIMSENRIDQMFRQFQNLESEPSPRVWQNIEAHLNNKKKKRVMPLFWELSVAASVLLAVGLFLLFDSGQNDRVKQTSLYIEPEKVIIDHSTEGMVAETLRDDVRGSSSSASTSASASTSVSSAASASTPGNIVLADFSKPENVVNVEYIIKQGNEQRSFAPEYSGTTDEEQKQGTEELKPLLSKSVLMDETNYPDASRLVFIKRKIETNYIFIPEKNQEKDVNSAREHFVLGGEYSPTYAFRNVSGPVPGSGKESGIMTSGGGVSFAMNVNKRWQIETGIKYAMLGQEVSAVSKSNRVFNSDFFDDEKVDITEISLVNSLGAVDREVSPQTDHVSLAFQKSPDELIDLQASASGVDNTSVLKQNLGYIRVPVTLRYQLLESGRIGLSLSGGISTNWLIDNDAYLERGGEKQRLGETNGLSKTGFSTHAGVAVAVPLYRGLRLRMEPRIDYFISDISEGSSVTFKPYSFGVFTGLFYEW